MSGSGTPTRRAIKVSSFDAYLALPSSGKAYSRTSILYLSDVLGLTQNAKLMADQFAANGYLTLIPDLFNTDCLPSNVGEDFDCVGWINHDTNGNNPHTKRLTLSSNAASSISTMSTA